MGLSPASVASSYLGNEEQYLSQRGHQGLLEVSDFHLFDMGMLLLVLTHLALFIPVRSSVNAWLVVEPFLSGLISEGGEHAHPWSRSPLDSALWRRGVDSSSTRSPTDVFVLYFAISAIIGLLAMYLLVSRLGAGAGFAIENEAAVLDLMAQEYPDHRPAEVVIAADGAGALVSMAGEPSIGLVQSLGTHATTRLLRLGDLQSASADEDRRLQLRLADFTFPDASIALSDEAQVEPWLERLRGLARGVPEVRA